MNQEIDALTESLRQRVAADRELAGFDIASMVQPSIRLGAEPIDEDELAMGASRIGGLPDVPPGWEWPRWTATKVPKFCWHPGQPAPLGFIAQIGLSEMPRFDDSLPPSGWLYFFYDRYVEPWGSDPADRGSCRVAYVNCDPSELLPIDPPDDMKDEHLHSPVSFSPTSI